MVSFWEIILIRLKEVNDFPECTHIVIPNPYTNPFGYASYRLFFLVPKRIKELNADVVIEPAHFGPFNLPKRIKRVTVIHDLTPLLFPHFHRFHSQILQRIFLPSILRKAHLIVTNSKNTQKDVITRFPITKGKTIFTYPTVQPHFLEMQLNSESSKYNNSYFLYTGTWEPRKDLSSILKAFKLYRESGGSSDLVLAGSVGWKVQHVLEELEKHEFRKQIHTPGFIPDEDLPSLMKNAKALVYVSHYEGFGLPVLEAMSCGTPVIVTNVSSLPEIAGDAGLYVNPGDFRSIANFMLQLNEDSIYLKQKEKVKKQSELFSQKLFISSILTAIKTL